MQVPACIFSKPPLSDVCVFIPSSNRMGTLFMGVSGTSIGAPFFKFELKPTGKDSADPTQYESQHHIGLEWSTNQFASSHDGWARN